MPDAIKGKVTEVSLECRSVEPIEKLRKAGDLVVLASVPKEVISLRKYAVLGTSESRDIRPISTIRETLISLIILRRDADDIQFGLRTTNFLNETNPGSGLFDQHGS